MGDLQALLASAALKSSTIERRTMETPYGKFTLQFGRVFDTEGPVIYATPETGEVKINGVTYRGSVTFKPPTQSWHGDEYWMDSSGCDRIVDGRFHSMTDAARRSLAAALLPAVQEMVNDTATLAAARAGDVRRRLDLAREKVTDSIKAYNALAGELRTYGEDAQEIPQI
jgi:hypothetical protein